ncbi:ArsR family transcriptional regulator (plasmid) [Priestia megaterium]|jgi:DNA-binding transcriptional ArsR family regulator
MYFTRNHITLSSLFYALNHPVRIKLLVQLIVHREISNNYFKYSGSKSNLSHHLKILRETGLTYTKIEGVKRRTILKKDLINSQFPGLLQMILENKDNIQ